jgi:hypothetical protein
LLRRNSNARRQAESARDGAPRSTPKNLTVAAKPWRRQVKPARRHSTRHGRACRGHPHDDDTVRT